MVTPNPLKALYCEETSIPLTPGQVALLCIDLQYLDAAPGYGCFANLTPELQQDLHYYFSRLSETVLPQIQQLQQCFRQAGQEVIHVRIQSLTQDGRDRSLEHKRIGLNVPPGSKEAEFLPEVAPVGDEIVISKTASGVFSVTNLNYVLRNLGISQLVIVGVFTNECIENAVRAAADLGYVVYVPHDGTASVHPDIHQGALEVMRHTYAEIVSTAGVIDQLQLLSAPMATPVS